jgi:hypothetical protein
MIVGFSLLLAIMEVVRAQMDEMPSSAHCSYLDIYISQNIRLYFERKFQTNLQAKDINFLI